MMIDDVGRHFHDALPFLEPLIGLALEIAVGIRFWVNSRRVA